MLLAVVLAVAVPTTASADRIAFSTYEVTGGTPSSTQNAYTATPQGTQTRLVARDATDPAWSPNGRWIAYVRGYREVWLVRADGTDHRRVSRPGLHASDPAWSPDGRRLAYTRGWEIMVDGYPESRSAVYIVRSDGGGARKLHRGSNGYGATWAADGRQIAFISRGRLATIRRDGTRLQTVRHELRPGHLQFSPAGRQLAFTDYATLPSAAATRILDLDTGTLRTIPHEVAGQVATVTWTRTDNGWPTSVPTPSRRARSSASTPSSYAPSTRTTPSRSAQGCSRRKSCRGRASPGRGKPYQPLTLNAACLAPLLGRQRRSRKATSVHHLTAQSLLAQGGMSRVSS